MTRLLRFVALGVALGLVMAGCDARNSGGRRAPGGQASLPGSGAPAARIISCAPNLTEMIFALGAGPSVIGVTRFCQYPAEARGRPPLGDLYQPNLEAMVAARPDLIVLAPGNRKVLDFFNGKAGGPRLLETNACETIGEIEATIRLLGDALDQRGAADSLLAAMTTGLDSVAREHAGAPPVRYLMILGHNEGALEQIYAVGAPTYLTELAALSGGVNVVEATLGRYPILSREAIVAMNPDVIVERALGGRATAEQTARLVSLWEELPTLAAVRAHRVRVLDDDHVTINGPDLARSARVLAGLIRP